MTPHPVMFSADQSLAEVKRAFLEQRFTLAPVVSSSGELVGVVSASDLMRLDDDAADGNIDSVMTRSVYAVTVEEPVGHAARVLSDGGVHHLVVVSGRRRPVGVISSLDIANAIREDVDFDGEAGSLIESHDLISVAPDSTAAEARALVEDAGVSALAVKSQDEIVGTVSQLRLLQIEEDALESTRVDEVMDSRVVSLGRHVSISEVARIFAEQRLKRVFLTDDDGQVLGVVTPTDLVRYTAGLSEIIGPV